jgi:hypothetical protein
MDLLEFCCVARRRASIAATVRSGVTPSPQTHQVTYPRRRTEGLRLEWSCEFGGAEPGVPDPLEVVRGAAKVQGEGVIEQAEPGQGGFQTVDRGGGGREHLPAAR